MTTPNPASRGAHTVRIIGGQWKRTPLPVANKPGLRPTPDRVRETLFNWLGQDLTGWRCVDAFAGTGALGFEAASRGATQVLMLEQDTTLAAQLRRWRFTLIDCQVHTAHLSRMGAVEIPRTTFLQLLERYCILPGQDGLWRLDDDLLTDLPTPAAPP